MEGERRRVNLSCANASNPFHVCSDSCAGKSSSHSKPRRIIGGGGGVVQNGSNKMMTNGGGRHVDSTCPNSSNPFHRCSDTCNRKATDARRRTQTAGTPAMAAQNGRRSKEVGEGRHVDPSCMNASNPFHQCGDHCTKKQSRGGKAATNGEISELERRNVYGERNLDSVEYYSPGSSGTRRLIKTNALGALLAAEIKEESKEGGSSSVAVEIEEESKEGVRSSVASETEEESKEAVGSSVAAESEEESKEGLSSSVAAEIEEESKEGVRSRVASEIEEESKEAVGSSVAAESGEESKEGFTFKIDRKVDPSCRNASSPFHVCTEYCSQGSNDKGRVVGGHSDRKVDPSCRNASNPLHVCSEYCSHRGNEVGGRSVAIASGSKGNLKREGQRRHTDPRCVNAANPFHICAEYCFQKIREAR